MPRRALYMAMLRTALARQRWVVWLLRLGVMGSILVWLTRQLNLQELQRVAVNPALLPLMGMMVTGWLFMLLGGIKFWVLYQAITPVAFRPFIGYFFVATALGVFTPASLGDFSLAALLRHERVPAQESLAVIVVDRLLTVSIYAVVFLPLTLGMVLHTAQWWWVSTSFAAGGILLLALNGVPAVRQLVHRVLLQSPLAYLMSFLATTSTLIRRHPWYLLGNIGLTLLRCVMAGIVVQLALWAVGEWQPFLPVLYTTNTISLLNLLPISLAGLGVYEGGGVAILSHLGFDREHVFAALIYQRLYVMLYALLMLVLWRMLRRNTIAAGKGEA